MTREERSLLDELKIFCPSAYSHVHRAMFTDLAPEERFDTYEAAIEALLARLKTTDMVLQKFAPGGGEKVANPELCAERIREVSENYRRMWMEERDRRIDLERQMQNMAALNPEPRP